jgi:hypothetical protein
MHTPTLVRPLRLGRPWPHRVASEFIERVAALAQGAHTALRRLRERRREQQELQAAADLSDALLRDMGAPDWLQAEAHARREAQRFERQLMRIEPVGDRSHYHWV